MPKPAIPSLAFALTLALVAPLAGCDDEPAPVLTAAQLLDPASCAECHPTHYREWLGSMHAYAAEDPVFRAMNARGQRETDGALGAFCVQCHAPMALRMGLTTDGTNLDDVPAHLRGVTCVFCHTVEAVDGTHNNPLRLASDGVMRGGIRDPIQAGGHAMAYSPLHDRDDLRSSALCGACHDVVTPNGVHLERTYLEWQQSLFNDPDPRRRNTCNDCHLPGRDEPIAAVAGAPVRRHHDHSMPGVDVALTPFPEAEAQRALVQRELDTLIVTELCVVPRNGGAEVEVYLENIAAGHSVPSGASHDRRLWVELVARAGGEVVYRSGVVGDGEPIAELADPDLWLLGERGFDALGRSAHFFWEIVRTEPEQLPSPNLLPPGTPGYVNPHVGKRYVVIGETPDRIDLRVRLRPMGLDVLDSLVASGDLDPAVRDAMPTFDLAGAALTWTMAAAELRVTPLAGREAWCVPRL
ncbi:MAG: hypothetical protein H6701_15270 [Myxococcales bacterium]|nr:hypothetical protein [Myxococcales bacterium]